MVDEPIGPSAQLASGLEALLAGVRRDMRDTAIRLDAQIEGLRDDVREDNQRTEDRVMNALQAMARAHAVEHGEENADRVKAFERFERFIKDAELAQARRDGVLGVFRFGIEVLSRNARPMAQILVGLAAIAGVLSGSISIAVH